MSKPNSLMSLRRSRVVVLLLAVLALVAAACSSEAGSPGKTVTKTGSSPAGAGSSSAPSTSQTPTTPPKTAVSMKTLNSDGATYGVGMPVIVYFSKKITDGKAFQAGTKTTANGQPLDTAWYFQYSSAGNGPIEAQLRPKDYWPANSKIHIQFPTSGTSLGGNDVLSTKLTSLDFNIGASHILTVDNSTHEMTLEVNGKKTNTYPVSLGASNTPTKRGIKVIMEKGRDISMRGPGYYDAHVKDTQRLTYGGEYLHNAFWNTYNIDHGINSSNGCTNLHPADAASLYNKLEVGDVVNYPNATGPRMQMGQGYGLWNVDWTQYQTGGLVPTQ